MKITQARLKELFDYNSDTGRLVRKIVGPWEKAITCGTTEGYFVRRVDKRQYLEHKLVYLYHHNEFPKELDHKNRNRSDNRIENLRPCGRSSNAANASMSIRNRSGYRGVCMHPCGKWYAQICQDGDNRGLGLYYTAEEAALAYNRAASELFGEFAHLNEVPCG